VRQAPVALYVHVPFCVSLCPYCDFVVLSGAAARGPRNRLDAWFGALLTELELRADGHDERFGPPGCRARPALRSVYLGGGTPSLLPATWIATLLERVAARFGIAAGAEVTLEANPGPDELGDLAGFRAAGIGRLSMGAQSLDAGELRRLGRRHQPVDVIAAVARARAAHFERISVDLLYDVPAQTQASWARTLDGVLSLGVTHVSAYALTLDDPDLEGLTSDAGDHLPLRNGSRRWRERARVEQDGDRAADLYLQADEALGASGLRWYEISNWAAPGVESRHNEVYWQALAYEALGPGAHAFDGALSRRWNAARLDGYVGALTPREGWTGSLPPGGEEELAPAAARAERTILALRTAAGVTTELAADPSVAGALRWGRDAGLLETFEPLAGHDPLAGQGLAAGQGPARLRLTIRGRLLSNELFLRLLPDASAGALPAG
jgi:oxygen-independent coproporphyrinogen-3 oxidase